MYVQRVRVVDFMPFAGEHVLEGIPAKPIGVVARYAGNPKRSNWAGKTSFLEAIRWCLFGVHRKRLEDGLIHRGAKECAVEVALHGGLLVRRRRQRGGPTKLALTVACQGAAEEFEGDAAQARLLAALGMGYDDVLATTTFAQGDTEALVGKTSGDRRRVVASWLDLDAWESAGKVAAKRASDAAATHRALASLPEESAGRTREEVAGELEEAQVAQVHLHQQLEGVEGQLEGWRRASEGAGLEGELERAKEEGRALKAQLQREAVVSPEEMNQARTRAGEAERCYGVALQELESAEALVHHGFDGQCPVMRAACPSSEAVRCAGEAAQKRLEEAQAAEQLALREVEEAGQVLDVLEGRQHTRAAMVERYNNTASRARRLNSEVEARRARLAELGNLDVEGLDAQLRELLEALATARAGVQTLKREVEEVEAREVRRKQRALALTKAAREARVASLVQRALGPMGIPARISAESLGVLEERGNALLAGTGLSFTLAWEREGKDLAPSCYGCGYSYRGQREKACPSCAAPRGRKRAEELEVLVEDGSGEVEDVRAKSGGARALVASAIRLAGGMLLRERRGSRVAWAEVDEPFGALDAENRANLARCFTAMLGAVGLEQAFIVSHDVALLEGLPARILITREGNTSRLSLEV